MMKEVFYPQHSLMFRKKPSESICVGSIDCEFWDKNNWNSNKCWRGSKEVGDSNCDPNDDTIEEQDKH